MGTALNEWVSNYVPRFSDPGLDMAGPAARLLRETIRNEGRTAATVAAAFWQSYVYSGALASALQAKNLDPTVVFRNEILVVAHDQQFTLLLIHPALASGEVVQFQATAPRRSLANGWATFSQKRGTRDLMILGEVPSAIMQLAALEANSARAFSVVVTGPVDEELTSVVSPPRIVDAGGVASTAGAWVQDGAHRVGVTAAYHAVQKGAAITVGGITATYLDGDELTTDSCFLEVAHVPAHTKTSHGPLKVAPRSNEIGTYWGSMTHGQARVVAFNYELPYIDPNLQQTVRTEQVTAKGDSGAALVDASDYLLGFAHSRSDPSAPFAYSSWIWADAVFHKLRLTPY